MAGVIMTEAYRNSLLTVLDELFERVHGFLLDPNTSLFETLATISAEEASRPIAAGCAPLAAQVNHLRFYIDVMMEGGRTGEQRPADWAGSWRVGPVNEAEWRALIERLRASYNELRQFVGAFEGWDEQFITGAFALVGHCAYHLGEIRQGLGVVRSRES